MNSPCEQGFTLIEVVIALAIFAIGMLGVSQMQLMGMRGNVYSDQYSTATRLAMEMFESVNNYALTEANFDADGSFVLPNQALSDWDVALGANFNGNVNVAFDAATRLNTVSVTVQWAAGNHAVSFTSQLAG